MNHEQGGAHANDQGESLEQRNEPSGSEFEQVPYAGDGEVTGSERDSGGSGLEQGGRQLTGGDGEVPDEQLGFVTRGELVRFTRLTHTSGPIPSGEMLAGIEAVVPGAAAEIVRQGNANVQADRENETRFVQAITRLDLRGQWMAYSLTILFGCASFTLFVLGIHAGGVTIGLVALAPIVKAFLERGTSPSAEAAKDIGQDGATDADGQQP